jgi:hypothetical protein
VETLPAPDVLSSPLPADAAPAFALLAPACALLESSPVGENKFGSDAELQAAANGTQAEIKETTTNPRAKFMSTPKATPGTKPTG